MFGPAICQGAGRLALEIQNYKIRFYPEDLTEVIITVNPNALRKRRAGIA
jgi:hypothetical protein